MVFDPKSGTKEQIAAAYNTALEKIKEKTEFTETPAVLAQREAHARIEAGVEELLKLDILNEEVTKEYRETINRIDDKKRMIERLYGITLTPCSLEAISMAGTIINDCYDNESARSEKEYSDELDAQNEESNERKEEERRLMNESLEKIEESITILTAETKLSIEREQSEYEYNLKRERKLAGEKRDALVRSREEELRVRENKTKECKADITARLEEITTMQKAVDDIPERIQEARQEGIQTAEKRLSREYGYNDSLEKKSREHKIASLQHQYDRLLEKYKLLVDEKNAISEKLAQCNAESRKLTSDTVRSIGGINILGPDKRSGADA